MQTEPTKQKGRATHHGDSTHMQTGADCAPGAAAHQPPAHLTPRHRRLLLALLDGPQNREEVDAIVGASNGPDEVMRVRRRFGLVIPCERQQGFDRDQHRVDFGVYSLTSSDRTAARKLVKGAAR